MNLGFSFMPSETSIDITVLASRCEELGFESLWVPEHPVIPVHTTTQHPRLEGAVPRWVADQVDPFFALSMASAVTTKLRLGTGVCLVPERNPLIPAKEVATLDMFSGGRFLFGIGAGWLREESEIMGADFEHRWSQTREAVLAMKELWTKTESEFHGRHYDFPPVFSAPTPMQLPHPPVLIGSVARNVLKRVVAWGDGWIPIGVTAEQVEEGRTTLDRLASEAGRNPTSTGISVFALPADAGAIRRFEEAGADRVIVPESPWSGGRDEDEALAQVERIAESALA